MICFECKQEFDIGNEGYEVFDCKVCFSRPGTITTANVKVGYVCGKCSVEMAKIVREKSEATYLSTSQIHEFIHHSSIDIV